MQSEEESEDDQIDGKESEDTTAKVKASEQESADEEEKM